LAANPSLLLLLLSVVDGGLRRKRRLKGVERRSRLLALFCVASFVAFASVLAAAATGAAPVAAALCFRNSA
jgi:hypothetical protein